VAWTTSWRLCWDAYAGARAYELQASTPEGPSRRIRRQAGRCFELEVAAGSGPRRGWRAERRVQLAVGAGQVAYRVRAVLDAPRVSGWSRSVDVGVPTAA
jgi:hypothetical protein